jgi:hypothetical protein
MADVGEEESFADGDVGGVLVEGGVGGALIGVPLPANMGERITMPKRGVNWAFLKINTN